MLLCIADVEDLSDGYKFYLHCSSCRGGCDEGEVERSETWFNPPMFLSLTVPRWYHNFLVFGII